MLYRYVTEGTFDAYMYQLLESKQKFISQIMTSKSPVRCAEDVDDTALSYAEIKALASGNPKIMEKMQLDADVAKLKLQKSAHLSERYMLEDQLFKDFPKEVSEEEERIAGYGADIEIAKENTHKDDKGFSPMIVQGKEITVKAEAGKAILAFCKKMTNPDLRPLGEYRGFKTEIGFDIFGREFFMMLRGKLGHRVTLGQDANGIITRLDNAIDSFFTKQCHCKERLEELKQQIDMLSLSGVYLPGKNEQDFRIPASLERFLREYPDTKAIYLHLDSDYAGRRGAAGFITVLGDRYDVRYLPPKYGKDYNDYLMHLIHLENLKTERTQKNELRKEKTEPR